MIFIFDANKYSYDCYLTEKAIKNDTIETTAYDEKVKKVSTS